jgi:hypothetical protein
LNNVWFVDKITHCEQRIPVNEIKNKNLAADKNATPSQFSLGNNKRERNLRKLISWAYILKK